MTKKYQKAKEDLAKVPTVAGQMSKMGHDGVTTTISLLPTAGAAPVGRQHKFVGGGFNLAAAPILWHISILLFCNFCTINNFSQCTI